MAGIYSAASGGGAPDVGQEGAHGPTTTALREARPSPLFTLSQPHHGARLAPGDSAAPTKAPKALKILIVGAIGVGKSALARRLATGAFETRYRTTLGVELIRCELERASAAPARLILWDTDGDFGHSIFASPYLAGVSGVMGVADATRPATVAQMASLLDAFDRADPGRPTCAVFTKCDLQHAAQTIEAPGGRPTFHVSAATGDGVLHAFESLVQAIARGA
jgi:Ras-related protein Rab-22